MYTSSVDLSAGAGSNLRDEAAEIQFVMMQAQGLSENRVKALRHAQNEAVTSYLAGKTCKNFRPGQHIPSYAAKVQ